MGNHELSISLIDLFSLLFRKRWFIVSCVLGMGFLAMTYTLTNTISYKSEATFQEKGKAKGYLDPRLTLAMAASQSQDSEIQGVLKSKRVMEKVVQQHGLQVSVRNTSKNLSYPQLFFLNLWVEKAYFDNKTEPLFEDITPPLSFTHVQYYGEKNRVFQIKFDSQETFVFSDEKSSQKGYFGLPFVHDALAFTLLPPTHLTTGAFVVDVKPLAQAIKDVTGPLVVESDKKDKNLIRLQYVHQNRILAKQLLDSIMAAYQEYLFEEQQRISDKQLVYLEKREVDSFEKLEKQMDFLAEKIASDAQIIGFIDSEKAIQFYAANQEQVQAKIMQIDLKIDRLRDLGRNDLAPYEQLVNFSDVPQMQEWVHKIGDLKNWRDSITLALYRYPSDDESQEALFTSQMTQWEVLQGESKEVETLLMQLAEKGYIEPSVHLKTKPKMLVALWEQAINESLSKLEHSTRETFYHHFETLCQKKEGCRNYLLNLKSFLDIKASSLKEELAHFQESKQEFDGIDLSLATELYKHYQKELEQAQTQKRQIGYLLAQIEDPQFALSSLSTVLQDPIALDIARSASSLEMKLKEEEKRTIKEQQRLQEELLVERNFLTLHLEQTSDLISVKEELLKEKIHHLQGVTLGVIYRQISFLEKQIRDLIEAKIEAFEQERKLLQQHLEALNAQLAKLPGHWVQEQLVKHHMQINQATASEITRLVENKNISANLDVIQSSPLDQASLPVLPKSPRVLLFAFLGAFIGFFGAVCYLLWGVVTQGIRASFDNLSLQGQKVVGNFTATFFNQRSSYVLDQDLKTLRHMAKEMGQSTLIASKNLGSVALPLVDLWKKRGKKVLHLHLDFTLPKEGSLVEYFKDGKRPHSYDGTVFAGGPCRYGIEYLLSPAFLHLLQKYKEEYDIVIAEIPSDGEEASSLAPYFDTFFVILTDETLQRLTPLFNLPKLYFLFGAS